VETVWVALIVVIGGTMTTLLQAWLIRRGKAQDYARQDEVAAHAAEAAELLAARQDAAEVKADKVARKAAEAASLLLAANERVAEQSAHAAEVTNGKLAQIHELVNSNLTRQMEDTRDAQAQQEILMMEVIRLHKAAGREPSKEALDAIAAIRAKVAKATTELGARAKATVAADAHTET